MIGWNDAPDWAQISHPMTSVDRLFCCCLTTTHVHLTNMNKLPVTSLSECSYKNSYCRGLGITLSHILHNYVNWLRYVNFFIKDYFIFHAKLLFFFSFDFITVCTSRRIIKMNIPSNTPWRTQTCGQRFSPVTGSKFWWQYRPTVIVRGEQLTMLGQMCWRDQLLRNVIKSFVDVVQ